MLVRSFLLPALLVLLFAPIGSAQDDLAFRLGTPPGMPMVPVPMGVMNPQNGNVHLEFPLKTYVQRNGVKSEVKLTYDSLIWHVDSSGIPSWSPVAQNATGRYGWRTVVSPMPVGGDVMPTPQSTNTMCNNSSLSYTEYFWSDFTFTDATGTAHPFHIQVDSSSAACYGTVSSNSGYASDGSGYFMTVTVPVNLNLQTQVWDSSGVLQVSSGSSGVCAPCGTNDTNGNYLSSLDELGRSIAPTAFSIPGVQQWAGSTIQWINIPVHSNLGGTPPEYNGLTAVVGSITLPDGRTYQFTYDQGTAAGHYGQLTGMTLPTGGQVNFGYTRINTSDSIGDMRLTSLSEAGTTWNFAYSPNTPYIRGTVPTSTTVTPPPDAAGIQNQSVYSFTTPSVSTWSEKHYAGAASGTPIRETDVQKDFPAGRVTQVTSILENGMSTTTQYAYAPNLPMITSKKEYDFTGTLARETDVSYLNTTAYTNLHILNRPTSIKVYGPGGAASGTLLAQTNYTYDSTAVSSTSGSLGNSVLGATSHDDANYSTSQTIRGNLTSVSEMVSPGSFIATKTNYYNILGKLVRSTDARGNSTSYDYTDKWASGTASCVPGSTYAYPTTVTYPGTATNKSVATYNACDGTISSAQDQNDLNASRAGTVYTYDGLQRVTNVALPDGGSQHTDYGGTALPQVVTKTVAITSTLSSVSTTTLDGLGRTVQTALASDPDGTTYTATTYDALGSVLRAYNPTRCPTPTSNCGESTWGYTTLAYDALGRTTSVTAQDGGISTTAYSGNTATVTDQAGKARKTLTDGLGRLITVWEDPGSLNYQTLYQYDALNNLTCVEQHGSATTGTGCSSLPSSDSTSPWRVRRFTYDSLSQLRSATNPESGAISYTYDNNGNVQTKTAPKPNQTATLTVTATYAYDPLNRLMQKSYNDGSTATVNYSYDGTTPSGCTPPAITGATNLIGRRSGMCDPSGASAWSYDPLGRTVTEKKTLNSVTNTFSYTYYLDGKTSHVYYPSGSHADYQVTSAGRSWGVSGPGGAYIPFNTKYAPHGAVSSMWLGASAAGQIYSNFYYSDRLQPQVGYARQFVNSVAGPLLYGYCYDFHLGVSGTFGDANVTCSVTASTLGDNGNVYNVSNQVNNARTQNFTYDALNRITQGYTTGGSWGETFTIDAWGNLTNRGLVAGKSTYESLNAAPATVKNRLTGFGYDAAGNMISNGSASYTYDAENRLTATAGWTYVYDGDGERVLKCNGTYPTCSSGTLYWGGTEALAESSLTGTMSSEYLFYLGKRMARNDLPGNIAHYYLQDHLGSARVTTDAAGATEKQTDYSPYGGEIWVNGTNVNHYKFNGKERDSESGLDNFGARYNASSLGRFMTPDWAARPTTVPYAVFGDPQSLNLYSYVRNDPISQADADGHEISEQARCPDPNGCTPASLDTQASMPSKQKPKESPAQNTPPVDANGNPVAPKLLPPPEAELKTDMNGHTTTFLATDSKDKLTVTTIETSNDVTKNAKPGAADPYNTSNITGVSNRHAGQAAFGPAGAFIDTGDSRGRAIHGGGSILGKHALDPQQRLCPTLGCTRGHNADVIRLGNAITDFQRANPGTLIPYIRE